ncbi:target of Nesh-SH3 isoform X2 [Hemibagrus wyckioides]|uniref:target of Nesh-SH3 isoform X2 n=1 Tax=Hemibagrus wyckioides TaxID=337641 RepID=UPI00266B6030|nr:target of Nesh-SH3 isoform X2 [Hemibagrus wyckioides]
MSGFLLLLILSEVLLPNLTCASRVRRQTTKVRISAIGDTIMLKFLQPDTDTRLEGYILGYGSSLFSKQLIELPEDGQPYETEIDAEPKYLVAVQPYKEEEAKKQCTGKETLEKPLHLVIGSVTETSVMLSWGTLLNTLATESNLDDCIKDGHYTVRYREKEPKKTWNYQTCPTSDTVIDQLKPDTPYEFGVRAESRNITGAWSTPVIHNTAVKEIDIYTPLEPENTLKPTESITESPQTFSPFVPVIQSRPASLLRHPEPPPTPRVTQAKDVVIPEPLKTENPLRRKKPITERPQTPPPSVPVLHAVTQSRPASLRHPKPLPTKKVTQDIHKPRKPEIFLRPEKPITESPQTFSTSVPVVTQSRPTSVLRRPEPTPTQRVMQVLHNVTQSRPAILLRHTAPPPIPRVTLGAGSDGIGTSHPSEDSLFLTQTFTSPHTPMSSLRNITEETHHSTKSSLSITTQKPLHSTQTQLTISKTLFNTPKPKTNRIKIISSTVKAQLNKTKKKKIRLPNKIHPQPETSTTKFTTTTQIQQKIPRYPIRTVKPKTRSPQPYTSHPKTSTNQSQHSTDLKMAQNKFTTLELITTQSQPHVTQPQSITTQSQPHAPQPQSITTQSQPLANQPQSITTQSQPHANQPQSITTQSQPHAPQPQSITTQSQPHANQPQSITTQSQPHANQPQSITTQSQPHAPQPQSITTQSQPHATQPQSITTQSQPHASQPHAPQPQSITTQSPPHATQPQSITTQSQPHANQPQSITTQSQPHATQPQSITTQSQPHATQPQSITTQSQPHATQPQSITTQSQPHATQPQSITTQSQPDITYPKAITTQSPPHTVQPLSIITQPHKTHPKPTATQSPTHTVQPLSITTQSQPHKFQSKPTDLQSPPQTTKSQTNTVKNYTRTGQLQPTTIHSQPLPAKPQSIAISAQPQSLLDATQIPNSALIHYPEATQASTTHSQPDRIQPHLKKTQSSTTEHSTKSQRKTVPPKLTTTQSKPRKKQQKPRPQQSRTTQTQLTTTLSSTAKSGLNFGSQQPVTNQQHSYIINPKFTPKPNIYQQFSTTLSTTEFQQPDHHPTSATIKLSNTNTWQNGKTEPTLRVKPKQPFETPSEKSNTQNLPRGQKKPVNKKVPVSNMAPSQSLDGHQTKPVLVSGATNRNQGQDMSSPVASVASTSAPTVTQRVSPISVLNPIRLAPTYSNTSVKNPQASHNEKHKGQLWNKHKKWNRKKIESNKIKNHLNQVDNVKDKVIDLKVVEALPILKPSTPPNTTEIYQKTTPTPTPFFAYNGSRYNMGDNSSVFSSLPISDLDSQGRKRYVASHVVYQDKPPEKPCSVTHTLSYFPDEENMVTNITGPPKTAPGNVTVVTVEGCPSFVIIDWEKTDNETTEYEVISTVKSPNGKVVSVVKTNQTHTAVENLKPESSYKFKVTPRNELGSGPSSEPVSFTTESADPRVSEVPTGKNAIWSSFKFEADTYSECTGTQYVKRTWYRKFVGIQLCNSLRYKIYLSDTLKGKFYNIGDETGYGEDHCQFVDSFLDGQTGGLLPQYQLPLKQGYFRAMRQEPVKFGKIGGSTQINYVAWYECGVPIPGSW